ncbi:MAG: hypothetical protein SXV54_18060 [Chloroflexota bacterium]|nr:hypothetical protein [Chloroflexota bacterium]
MGSALGGLAWEARQKAGVDGQANHARSQARALAAQAEEMGRYLQRKAQAFEEADGRGVDEVGQVFGAFTEWAQGAPSWWGFPSQQVNAWWNLGGVLGEQSPIELLRLPAVVSIAVVGVASLSTISGILPAVQDLRERVWNWLHGKGWKTDEELAALEPVPAREPAEPETMPKTEMSTQSPKHAGTKTVKVNTGASTKDCVEFVRGQRDNVPPGFSDKEFYSGKYKGKSGTLANGAEYGQEPRAGSIMVESPNTAVDISYGHASYVYEVQRDALGRVVGFKIAEGRWDMRPKDQRVGPPPVHYEEFHWDEGKGCYVSPRGKRSPDMFIL